MRGPNDIVFDVHGGFYFTDFGKMRPRDRDTTGLFYAKADGSFIAEVVHPMDAPNGIGLSPDGKIVYAAETFSTRLWAFPVEAPGRLGPARHLYRPAGFTWFDSLAVEENGNICVATLGESGISVVSPRGRAGRVRADARFLHHQHRVRRPGHAHRVGHPVRKRAAGEDKMAAPRPPAGLLTRV